MQESRIRARTPDAAPLIAGRPGNWVALAATPRKVVAEAKTLAAAATKARALGYDKPAFARVPRTRRVLVV
ncbi:MAG: hypothetical protein NTX53_16520 [candidate division WOR-3 bacterium]|nr:hypothetical protein [candidate division WOR-3 bacterium]